MPIQFELNFVFWVPSICKLVVKRGPKGNNKTSKFYKTLKGKKERENGRKKGEKKILS